MRIYIIAGGRLIEKEFEPSADSEYGISCLQSLGFRVVIPEPVKAFEIEPGMEIVLSGYTAIVWDVRVGEWILLETSIGSFNFLPDMMIDVLS